MKNPTFSSSVKNIVNTFNKPNWVSPLTTISEKYALFDRAENNGDNNAENTDDLDFDTECLNMLLQLQKEIETDPNLPLSRLVAIRLAGLECWNYRMQIQGASQRYLNPLFDTLNEFDRFKNETAVSLSTSPYPPIDMIRRWAREHLQ